MTNLLGLKLGWTTFSIVDSGINCGGLFVAEDEAKRLMGLRTIWTGFSVGSKNLSLMFGRKKLGFGMTVPGWTKMLGRTAFVAMGI